MHLSIVHGVRIETKEDEVICKNKTNLDFKKKLLCDFHDSDQQIVSQHAASKLFKCEICENSYSLKGNLKKHIEAVHENKKSFKCDICDYSCSQKDHMKTHIESVHEKKKTFKSDICYYRFSYKNVWKTHKQSMKIRSNSNVIFVTTELLKRVI